MAGPSKLAESFVWAIGSVTTAPPSRSDLADLGPLYLPPSEPRRFLPFEISTLVPAHSQYVWIAVGYASGFEVRQGVCFDDIAVVIQAADSSYHQVTSVGYRSTSPEGFDALWDAFRTSYNQHGVLWFVAAGNTGGGSVTVPALFPEVIAVSSVESNGSWSSFSAQDDEVELSAPGGTQWLSWNRRDDVSNSLMRDVQGTSFAAPMAAGVARLALHKYPSWTASQLRENMRLYARDRGTPGWDRYYGYGQVDAVCLLNMTAPCNP